MKNGNETIGGVQIVLPTRSEIEAAVGPYVTRRMPMNSPEWREIYEHQEAKEKKKFRKTQWKKWLPWLQSFRPQTLVSSHYETHWNQISWPKTRNPDPNEKPVICTWDDEGMLIRRYGRKRPHHLALSRIIEALAPKNALEVGSGNGINLLIMSTLFPKMDWAGIELTKAGVEVARSIQAEPELPPILREFAIAPLADASAHRRAKIEQGDATKLPFPDNSFELVFTIQALEQMQPVRDAALREIARVASKFVVCIEPFAEFNQTAIQKYYTNARSYFDLSVTELAAYGLTPKITFGDWPHKLTLGIGLMAAEVNK